MLNTAGVPDSIKTDKSVPLFLLNFRGEVRGHLALGRAASQMRRQTGEGLDWRSYDISRADVLHMLAVEVWGVCLMQYLQSRTITCNHWMRTRTNKFQETQVWETTSGSMEWFMSGFQRPTSTTPNRIRSSLPLSVGRRIHIHGSATGLASKTTNGKPTLRRGSLHASMDLCTSNNTNNSIIGTRHPLMLRFHQNKSSQINTPWLLQLGNHIYS